MSKQTQTRLGIAAVVLSIIVLIYALFIVARPNIARAAGTAPPTPTSTVAALQMIHYRTFTTLLGNQPDRTIVGSDNFYAHVGAAQISATVIAAPTPGVQTYAINCLLNVIEPGNNAPGQTHFSVMKESGQPQSTSPFTVDSRTFTIGSPISSLIPLSANVLLTEGVSNVSVQCGTDYTPKTSSAPKTLNLEVIFNILVGTGASSFTTDTAPIG